MTIASPRRVVLGGSPVDLARHEEAVRTIADRAAAAHDAPLGVLSVNVDHVNHFGHGGRWQHVLERRALPPVEPPTLVLVPVAEGSPEWTAASVAEDAPVRPVEWLSLIDGSPIAKQAERLTGSAWPRLAGSDLIGPLLDRAATDGVRVGVLGGSEAAQSRLRARLAEERPDLVMAGLWSPSREELADATANAALVDSIRAAGVDLLIVGLGKPRQELWIDEHGPRTGAHVLLAFGAAVDFLGGSVRRAPQWVADRGVEWLWRLALEPRRLARRYLVEGPLAYARLRQHSTTAPQTGPALRGGPHLLPVPVPVELGRFVGPGERADVAALVVSYRSAATMERLLASLRAEAATGLRIRVVVVDNASDDGSLALAAAHSDVIAVDAGANVGYAAAINIARRHAGDAGALLVLNPDLVVLPGAVSVLLDRMDSSSAGIVVPLLRDATGAASRSLRREPTRLRALGDALLGDRVLDRPAFSSETDSDPESYRHAHRIDWATGAAMLIDALVAARLGDWDERFFLYSEETDYFRRARELGAEAWFEPAAQVVHDGAGSGSSSALGALLAVNRVRYVQKFHGALYSGTFRLVVLAAESARSLLPGDRGRAHRHAALALAVGARLAALPSGAPARPVAAPHPSGSVVVPAHDEEAVIARTLAPLAAAAASGALEVVVVCNACTDRTAEIARGFAGVTVVEIAEASKTAALNAGDAVAATWPRLYLDADVGVTADAVWTVFDAVTRGGLLAARPTAVYDATGADPLVRAYYRARSRTASLHTALWGAGGYAVSGSGHERIGAFPALIADDEFVDGRFSVAERAVVATAPAVVQVPRSAASLLGVLRRTQRGSAELAAAVPDGERRSSGTAVQVLRSAQGPIQLADAAVYLCFALASRLPRRQGAQGRTEWTRDETTRRPGAARSEG
ncbi:WecB/TagA/CpsF family glycosyltransferase [Rathayibacter sp. VKM Ac-2856]|uniref:WecB/TagA/CpsF family glycosyltransferase n=1 Tax=unclassified Rathayibacter TaxID=2609250 RepID=UPI0015638568|nr:MULTISPECIES: WecB/TagA/CpsF family glycosyltransferase [unclassified Rathayibacter]NQX06699.1 WecB/TagA/CpsF family glycosyltransferase [Rathayibacter sp. VKM Ac-2858]NQX21866.1 WecB/TagA/CpsF family glycosyltransferase [Rathayibacter sp. VKM Ac-2856]